MAASRRRTAAAASCIALVSCAQAATPPSLVFSAGFTDDMVLQRAPAAAAVYGLVFPSGGGGGPAPPSVQLDLLRDGSVVASVAAAVGATAGVGSGCDAQCYDAGYTCAVGQSSCCSAPSCPMGCLMAAATESVAACVAECKAAKAAGCSYTIPNTTTKLTMCDDCLPQCPGCPDFEAQCEAGCGFGHAGAAPALGWKALLPPMPAGGAFTLAANCTAGCAAATAPPPPLERLTFGDVFYASGQSNMALGVQHSFQYAELVANISAGRLPNIRVYQYGGMSAQVDGTQPAWATTVATAPFWPWQNLSTAVAQSGYPGFATMSATAIHFAAALTSLRGGTDVPIGIITNAVGGTTIEAWSSREMLAVCTNTTSANSAAPPTSLFYGMVTPFVNMTIGGWLWFQGENNCGGDGTPGNSAQHVGYGCSLATLVRTYRALWSATPGTTPADAPFGIFTLAAGGSEGSGQHMAGIRWSQTANYGVAPNPALPNAWVTQLFDMGDPWLTSIDRNDAQHCAHVDPATGSYGPNCTVPWTNLSAWDAAVAPLAPLVRNDSTPTFLGSIHSRNKGPAGARAALQYHNLVDGGAGPVTGPTISGCRYAPGAAALTLSFNASLLRGDTVTVSPFDTNVTGWGTGGDSIGFMVCVLPAGHTPDECAADVSLWSPAAAAGDGTGAGVTLALTPAQRSGGTLAAVRYGWPIDGNHGDTCCPARSVTQALQVCMPAACPLKASPSLLPGNPFYAVVTGGRCACTLPQDCSA